MLPSGKPSLLLLVWPDEPAAAMGAAPAQALAPRTRATAVTAAAAAAQLLMGMRLVMWGTKHGCTVGGEEQEHATQGCSLRGACALAAPVGESLCPHCVAIAKQVQVQVRMLPHRRLSSIMHRSYCNCRRRLRHCVSSWHALPMSWTRHGTLRLRRVRALVRPCVPLRARRSAVWTKPMRRRRMRVRLCLRLRLLLPHSSAVDGSRALAAGCASVSVCEHAHHGALGAHRH